MNAAASFRDFSVNRRDLHAVWARAASPMCPAASKKIALNAFGLLFVAMNLQVGRR